MAEQQLLSRWQQDIKSLIRPVEKSLLNRGTGLEFGIEDTLTLKINLKSRGTGITPGILDLMTKAPELRPWGKYVLDNQLRFHCGIKLTPDRLSHELYIYPKEYTSLEPLIGKNPFLRAVQQLQPIFIGIDDHRGLSMYYTALNEDWIELLRLELGLPDWGASKLWAWQQLRFDGSSLIAGKTAMELSPMSTSVLARFASHYPFPHFKYLIPLKQHSSGNIGRDPVTGRFALYATVN